MNCFALMIFNIMNLVPNGHLFLKITLFSYYITFRHRFQDSFVAKAKTIHLYFYVLVIQNQFLHFCTCTMWAQYNVLSTLHWPFLCATVFSKGEGAEKTTKIRIFMEAFFLARGSFNNYVDKTKQVGVQQKEHRKTNNR